jgi:hypothetical protein
VSSLPAEGCAKSASDDAVGHTVAPGSDGSARGVEGRYPLLGRPVPGAAELSVGRTTLQRWPAPGDLN